MSLKYAQLQPFTLAGSGAVVGATTIFLTAFNSIDGVPLAMTDFGDKGFITLEPGSLDFEEQISFTGVTQNANGTATLTGVKNVLFLSPYTETSGLSKAHGGGVTAVVSNTSGFYNEFVSRANNEVITGLWQFPSGANNPIIGVSYVAPTIDNQIATKKYVDDVAVSGAPDANETTKGLVQLATNAQMGTATSLGSTGARLIPPNDQLKQTSAGAGDANKIPTLGGAGTLAVGFLPVVTIAKGGTGQATQTLGFDALSPSTTKGDLIVNDGTNDIRLAVGTNGQILSADSTQTSGTKWSSPATVSLLSKISQSTTPVTVANTLTETTIISQTVTGGTLGTANGVCLKTQFQAGVNMIGDSVTIRLKYGGTIIATIVTHPGVASESQHGWIEFELYANGAAASQKGSVFCVVNVDTGSLNTIESGSSAINSAVNQTLLVTAQHSNATADNSLTMQDYLITSF